MPFVQDQKAMQKAHSAKLWVELPFFTVNYWRRVLSTCDTSIVGVKANYVSDDTSARLRFQKAH